MEKAETKEILRKASVEVDIQGHGKVLCLFESDFDNVAMKLVNKNDDLHNVSYSVAQQYAEFCVRCDREKLPLIKIEDYLKQL